MSASVFGIYQNRDDLTVAVRTLRAEGFGNNNISVLLPNEESRKNFAHEKRTKAPEGAAIGMLCGAILGAIVGGLTGAGAIVFEGAGPFIAAGPIMGTLAGLGLLGAIGAIIGSLVGLALPEYEAKRYEGEIINGGTLLSVQCEDSYWKDLAKDILKETNARDISSSRLVSSRGYGSEERRYRG